MQIGRNTRFLIVGQGLCGSWLSWWLEQAGADFVVMDEWRPFSPSRIASGIINPVSGRPFAAAWMIEQLMAHAPEAYGAAGKALGYELIRQCPIVEFFPSAQMRESFAARYAENPGGYTALGEDETDLRQWFNFELGYGVIRPAFHVQVNIFLNGMRKRLKNEGRLLEQRFEPAALQIQSGAVTYENIKAGKIIFCDGQAAADHSLFRLLPFVLTKGEMLTVSIPGLPAAAIYKKGLSLAPYDDGLFWAGSTYDRDVENELPTAAFRQRTEAWLQHFVKLPFEITGHHAALRPGTVERRPFVGLHPLQPAVGILNGMGTKGVSLAPYFARQLAEHLLHGTAILPEASVSRFEKILSRTA